MIVRPAITITIESARAALFDGTESSPVSVAVITAR